MLRITKNEDDIGELETGVSNNDDAIIDLTSRVGDNEDDIDALETKVSNTDGAIINLTPRIT